MIKFNKHHVTNGETKARVIYCTDNRADGRKCVTMYAKDYGGDLAKVFATGLQAAPGVEYKNDTDLQSDYFDAGRVVLFEQHPLYAAARQRAESIN